MYFILPISLLAGFADWLCHRASHIETTTGAKESLILLLMFAKLGGPLLAATFLEVNALIIAAMIMTFFIHEATAYATPQSEPLKPQNDICHSRLHGPARAPVNLPGVAPGLA
jgi:hypothetical protein